MAGLKKIDRRLKSVKNTKKITYAMKLVSAAKLRRAQEAVTKAREYAGALNELLAELVAEQGSRDISHALMKVSEPLRNIRLVVVGGGRGLCGAYNSNVNKMVNSVLADKKSKNPAAKLESVLVGRKPAEYFRRLGRSYLKSYEKLPEDVNLWPIEEIAGELERDFVQGHVDQVILIYTGFRSVLSQSVRLETLLPLQGDFGVGSRAAAGPKEPAGAGVTLFEPSVAEVFSAALPRILRTKIRQACLEAKVSEHASRMTAMDAATKNSSELIYKLTLSYNNLRQAMITAELLDIIGGAEALT